MFLLLKILNLSYLSIHMMRRSVGERVENLFVLCVLFDCCIVEVVRGFVLCCVLGGWVVWGGRDAYL